MEFIELDFPNVLAFKKSKQFKINELEILLKEAHNKVRHFGTIDIYEELNAKDESDSFPWFEHFNYLWQVGLSNIEKVVIITDEDSLSKIKSSHNNFFSRINIKFYSFDEKKQALRFLKK